MKSARNLAGVLVLMCAFASVAQAQQADAPPPPEQGQSAPGFPAGNPRRGEPRQRPLIGKITSINGNTLSVQKPDGSTVTVRISDTTEFRKDREAAKLSDFKVGDGVLVRGEEADDHTVNASTIATRTGGFTPGQGGPGGQGRGANLGALGRDYVVGQVTAIDAPKLTVQRVDNVTQTLELNEETSLRKGRESITMADIQIGDHVMARGAAQGEGFVPKSVMVFSGEQWKRMEEMGFMRREGAGVQKPGANDAAPAQPQPKPQEQPN